MTPSCSWRSRRLIGLADPHRERPSCRRPGGEGMTAAPSWASPHRLTPASHADERRAARPPRQVTTHPSVSTIMRRPASASRPCGRYAVALRASHGPRRRSDAPQQPKDSTATPCVALAWATTGRQRQVGEADGQVPAVREEPTTCGTDQLSEVRRQVDEPVGDQPHGPSSAWEGLIEPFCDVHQQPLGQIGGSSGRSDQSHDQSGTGVAVGTRHRSAASRTCRSSQGYGGRCEGHALRGR
jgi:hypothetical protein